MIGFGEWLILIFGSAISILVVIVIIWVIYKSIISFQKGKAEADKELEEWKKKYYD